MADAIASRETEFSELIAAIDEQIAAIQPKLLELDSEALLDSGSVNAGSLVHGTGRIRQLLELRKEYVTERNALPFAGEYNLEAGTDAYGKDLDET